jgi:hypothetical protein
MSGLICKCHTNLRNLPGTNTLAYFALPSVTKGEKKFYNIDSRPPVQQQQPHKDKGFAPVTEPTTTTTTTTITTTTTTTTMTTTTTTTTATTTTTVRFVYKKPEEFSSVPDKIPPCQESLCELVQTLLITCFLHL